MAAAVRYTERQPLKSVNTPANVRARRMPITTPLVTIPSIRPRSVGLDSVDANATSVCVTVARKPTKVYQ